MTSAARTVFTLIALAVTLSDFNLIPCIVSVLIPEFLSTVLFAFLPHLIAKAALRPFHLTREERTGV